jgi:hypothetical protein
MMLLRGDGRRAANHQQQQRENRMTNARWIRVGLLAGGLCTGLGAAHAQSCTLRQQTRAVAHQSGVRPTQQVQVANAIWDAVTGYIMDAFARAYSGPTPPRVTPTLDDRFFDV